MQKCGLLERKFSGVISRLVKLQRPPPDMRIFLPTLLLQSSTNTERLRSAAVAAQNKPAAPAPIMMTSLFFKAKISTN